MRRHTEGAMRTNTLRGGLARGRSAVLIVSLLTIAAIGMLQALPCFAANADDFTSAEPSQAPGPAPKSDDAVRVRVIGARHPGVVACASDRRAASPERNRHGGTRPQASCRSRIPTNTRSSTAPAKSERESLWDRSAIFCAVTQLEQKVGQGGTDFRNWPGFASTDMQRSPD